MAVPSVKDYLHSHEVDSFSEESVSTAQELIEKLYSRSQRKIMETQHVIVSSLIISELILSQNGLDNKRISLKQILSLFKTSVGKVLKALDAFVGSVAFEEQIRTQIFLLIRDEIIFLMFFEKYESLSKGLTIDNPFFVFGWLLFVRSKNHFLLNNPHDYEKNLCNFLCSFSLYQAIQPENITKISSDDDMPVDYKLSLNSGDSIVKDVALTLFKLCSMENANYSMYESYFQDQFWDHILTLNLQPQGNFKEWLLPENIEKNIEILTKSQDIHCKPFRLDFRDITRESYARREPPCTPGGSKRSDSDINTSLKSPNVSSSPLTSSCNTITSPFIGLDPQICIDWLTNLLPSSNEAIPSDNLSRFFSLCSSNPSESIKERFNQIKETKLSNEQEIIVKKLYYHVLEAMLVGEEQRLGKSDFTTLLNLDMFHNALISSCVEVIAFVYQVSDALFPKCINVFSVTAFELSKVLDNIIRYVPNTPDAVKLHLSSVDQSILDCLLWKTGSQVYELLEKGGKQQQLHLQQVLLQKLSGTSTNSPKSNRQRSQLYSPAKPPGNQFRSLSLELIYRKLLTLIVSRSRKLITDLGLDRVLVQTIEALIRIITLHYSLLQDRHVDQIIICTVYGVARATKLEITFRKILQHYKLQPQADSDIWKSVLIRNTNDTKEFKNVIDFYNEIFIVEMEKDLLNFQSLPTQLSMGDVASTPNSPVKVKITVASPLARSRAKSGLIYNVGQSPVKDLRRYNDQFNTKNNKRNIKRSLFSDTNDPPSKKQKIDDNPTLSEAINSLSNNELTKSQPSILKVSK